jgi:hypothetical protein
MLVVGDLDSRFTIKEKPTICFTICLFISPDLDGSRAPKTRHPTKPNQTKPNQVNSPDRFVPLIRFWLIVVLKHGHTGSARDLWIMREERG